MIFYVYNEVLAQLLGPTSRSSVVRDLIIRLGAILNYFLRDIVSARFDFGIRVAVQPGKVGMK